MLQIKAAIPILMHTKTENNVGNHFPPVSQIVVGFSYGGSGPEELRPGSPFGN